MQGVLWGNLNILQLGFGNLMPAPASAVRRLRNSTEDKESWQEQADCSLPTHMGPSEEASVHASRHQGLIHVHS